MLIETRLLADIRPYPNNPRDNDQAIDAVAESIRRFGFRQPIVVDADGVIVCGHTRWKAAQKLGLAEAPVHVARDLTPDQARAYRVADNKTAEIAEWNLDLLPAELGALGDVDWSAFGCCCSFAALPASRYVNMPWVCTGIHSNSDIFEIIWQRAGESALMRRRAA